MSCRSSSSSATHSSTVCAVDGVTLSVIVRLRRAPVCSAMALATRSAADAADRACTTAPNHQAMSRPSNHTHVPSTRTRPMTGNAGTSSQSTAASNTAAAPRSRERTSAPTRHCEPALMTRRSYRSGRSIAAGVRLDVELVLHPALLGEQAVLSVPAFREGNTHRRPRQPEHRSAAVSPLAAPALAAEPVDVADEPAVQHVVGAGAPPAGRPPGAALVGGAPPVPAVGARHADFEAWPAGRGFGDTLDLHGRLPGSDEHLVG